jgi:hypothetical protein
VFTEKAGFVVAETVPRPATNFSPVSLRSKAHEIV